jgi:hypothetical protein
MAAKHGHKALAGAAPMQEDRGLVPPIGRGLEEVARDTL